MLVPTPNTTAPIDWSDAMGVVRRRALDQLQRALGVEGLEQRIEAEATVSPADWRAMNINHGATFSLAHTLDQMLHRRPQHRLQDVDGVWLVGGGTHPGSGLPVIFLSAQITARLLCEEAGAGAPSAPVRARAPKGFDAVGAAR